MAQEFTDWYEAPTMTTAVVRHTGDSSEILPDEFIDPGVRIGVQGSMGVSHRKSKSEEGEGVPDPNFVVEVWGELRNMEMAYSGFSSSDHGASVESYSTYGESYPIGPIYTQYEELDYSASVLNLFHVARAPKYQPAPEEYPGSEWFVEYEDWYAAPDITEIRIAPLAGPTLTLDLDWLVEPNNDYGMKWRSAGVGTPWGTSPPEFKGFTLAAFQAIEDIDVPGGFVIPAADLEVIRSWVARPDSGASSVGMLEAMPQFALAYHDSLTPTHPIMETNWRPGQGAITYAVSPHIEVQVTFQPGSRFRFWRSVAEEGEPPPPPEQGEGSILGSRDPVRRRFW